MVRCSGGGATSIQRTSAPASSQCSVGASSAPDFQAYLPFVELSFLAFWTKSAFLEKKRRFIDPELFERFRRDAAGA